MLEAKVGTDLLKPKQIEAYLDLARCHQIDAVITISNQFVTNPSLNPVQVSRKKTRSVDLYHWSWMLVLTHCTLLLGNEQVRDEDQSRILSEFVLFLSHDSTGVRGFELMPKCWPDIVNKFSSGERINKTDSDISELISAWYQEEKDICLILSRIIQNTVTPKLPRSAQKDINERRKIDIEFLCADHSLRSILSVPDAAAPINIKVDLASRYIQVSMRIQAPGDKVTGIARINWLLRQLSNIELKEGIDVISNWSGKTGGVRASLTQIREKPEFALNNDRSNAPTSFEIVMFSAVKAGRFKSRKSFVAELEDVVTKFYDLIGQNLKAWQPSAPKVKSRSASTKAVSTETIQEDFEERQSDES